MMPSWAPLCLLVEGGAVLTVLKMEVPLTDGAKPICPEGVRSFSPNKNRVESES